MDCLSQGRGFAAFDIPVWRGDNPALTMKTITLRSLVVAAVLAVAIVLGARADEFSLKGRDGKSWGPCQRQAESVAGVAG
jgi:hypothetical protein